MGPECFRGRFVLPSRINRALDPVAPPVPRVWEMSTSDPRVVSLSTFAGLPSFPLHMATGSDSSRLHVSTRKASKCHLVETLSDSTGQNEKRGGRGRPALIWDMSAARHWRSTSYPFPSPDWAQRMLPGIYSALRAQGKETRKCCRGDEDKSVIMCMTICPFHTAQTVLLDLSSKARRKRTVGERVNDRDQK